MAAESCHSRSLSWLVKSCIPADPGREISLPVAGAANSSGSSNDLCGAASPAASPIAALPEELLLECLSRVPRASLALLPFVCRRFASLLRSEAFTHLRRAHGLLHPSLLAVSVSELHVVADALLRFSPSPAAFEVAALPLPLSISHCNRAAFAQARAVAVGRAVYVVGRGATLCVDAITAATSARAPTLFPRKKFAAATVGGKIYVAGGSVRSAAVEEYDPEADAWRVIAEAPRRRYGCAGAAAGGVFYVAGGVAVSGDGVRSLETHVCAGSVDAFHVASGVWARPRALPSGGCVVGACGVREHLYVLARHTVELSFWRWGGGGRGGRRGAGGWVALEAPPVEGRSVVPGAAVRVAMAAVGGAKVAAVLSVAAVRGHATAAAAAASALEGAVFVYDIASGKWSRGPELPPGFRRAACVGVEC